MWGLALVTALTFGSGAVETPQVVNGNDFEPGSVPWLVRLDGTIGPCSGVLLAPSWVLTAAHCEASAETALVGAVTLDDPDAPMIPVAEWYSHPNWDGKNYDIAVARLATPLWGVQSMSLARSRPPVGLWSGTAGGWGEKVYSGDYPYLDVDEPQWSEIDEVLDCSSDLYWRNYDPVVCAVSYLSPSCNGDSGSPLVGSDKKIYGIAIRGRRGCGIGTSTLFTDTSDPSVRNWIYKTISGGIVANMEWPSQTATGIELVGGWAFSTDGRIESLVSLWVDGLYSISMPCCYDRGDVRNVYPEADLMAGFAGLYNWTKLVGVGSKIVSFRVQDSQGNELRLERRVDVD